MSNALFIVGTGAHARKVCHAARSAGHAVESFADDKPDATTPVPSIPVVPLAALPAGAQVFVAIGDANARRRLMEALAARGFALPAIVHAHASVAPDAVLEAGAFVGAGAVVESAVGIGRGVIVDVGAVVDHDATLAAYCHLKAGQVVGPGAHWPV
jgi:bacillosamine biosynthesis N-acetyltransferase PglD-like protein